MNQNKISYSNTFKNGQYPTIFRDTALPPSPVYAAAVACRCRRRPHQPLQTNVDRQQQRRRRPADAGLARLHQVPLLGLFDCEIGRSSGQSHLWHFKHQRWEFIKEKSFKKKKYSKNDQEKSFVHSFFPILCSIAFSIACFYVVFLAFLLTIFLIKILPSVKETEVVCLNGTTDNSYILDL